MKARVTFRIILAAIAVMIGIAAINGENLVKEDGTVSATKLPMDQENAKASYETATFGMG